MNSKYTIPGGASRDLLGICPWNQWVLYHIPLFQERGVSALFLYKKIPKIKQKSVKNQVESEKITEIG